MFPNIEAERARRKMTVEDLTSVLGVSRKTYYNWCAKGKIPQSKIEKMADIFNVSIDYLLSQEQALNYKYKKKGVLGK
jgi:transcriptional regulator with XRE-family HTH domain